MDNTEVMNKVQELVKFASDNKLSELEFESKEYCLKVKKHEAVQPAIMSMAMPYGFQTQITENKEETEVANEKEEYSSDKLITTPLAGIFYRTKTPTSAPLVKEGDYVTPGTVIGLVSACKNHNEIISDKSGRIAKFLVDSEDNVARGDAIAVLE